MRLCFVIPGDLGLPTGGYRYDREVIAALPGMGIAVEHVALSGSYPFPTDHDREASAKALAALPRDTIKLIDGLAFGAFGATELGALHGPVVALVHHPLALETGLDAKVSESLCVSEREALKRASAVIVPSSETGMILARDYDVPAASITVAEPGVAAQERAGGSALGEPVHLVALGAISPRKGYDVLVQALARLDRRDWRLTIAGSDTLNPAAAATLRTTIAEAGLSGQVALTGTIDSQRVPALMQSADLFVMPSHYEGYGMVLTEAIAFGLPVITTTGVPAALGMPRSAVVIVPANDVAGLSDAIAAMLDTDTRRHASDAAWAHAAHLPRWETTAARVAQVLRRVQGQPDDQLPTNGTRA